MIEFVLVLPVLLVLLLGAIDWGFYFMIREVVINATREGARVGSVASDSGAAIGDATVAARNYLQNALGGSYAIAPTVTRPDGSDAVRVRYVDFPVVPGRPASSITGLQEWTRVPITITAESRMRLESP
jgi:Flp pilus assembly protein TadG